MDFPRIPISISTLYLRKISHPKNMRLLNSLIIFEHIFVILISHSIPFPVSFLVNHRKSKAGNRSRDKSKIQFLVSYHSHPDFRFLFPFPNNNLFAVAGYYSGLGNSKWHKVSIEKYVSPSNWSICPFFLFFFFSSWILAGKVDTHNNLYNFIPSLYSYPNGAASMVSSIFIHISFHTYFSMRRNCRMKYVREIDALKLEVMKKVSTNSI